MAVAWSKDKVGKASGDVMVRDPVVLTATLPRFLRTGDRGAVQLELDNVEGAAGDYSVAISSEGTVKLDGDKPLTLKLAAKQRDHLSVPVSAAGSGASTINVSVSGPNGFALERAFALDVRPANQILTRRSVRALEPRRDADAVEGHVRRLRAGHRARRPVGRDLDLARYRDAAERTRPLSVRLFGTDHQPRGGDALCQRIVGAGETHARRRHRSAHQRRHPASAGAPRLERLVRPVVGRRRGSCGSMLT